MRIVATTASVLEEPPHISTLCLTVRLLEENYSQVCMDCEGGGNIILVFAFIKILKNRLLRYVEDVQYL